MKKLLCYLAILILIAFIVIPPVVRSVYKDIDKPVEKTDEYAMMTCGNGVYTMTSYYKNSEILNISLDFSQDDENIRELKEEPDNSFEHTLYKELESDTAKVDNSTNDIVSYKLVFANSEKYNSYSYYTSLLDTQKTAYEAKGYTCTVNK